MMIDVALQMWPHRPVRRYAAMVLWLRVIHKAYLIGRTVMVHSVQGHTRACLAGT
jgi:hypothetical protein